MKQKNALRKQVFIMLMSSLIILSSCKSEYDADKTRTDKDMETSSENRYGESNEDKSGDMTGNGLMAEMNSSMKTMMDKMHNYKMTGDPDYDFVMMMTPHHEASIEMSNVYLSEGKDQKLKDIVQKSIIKQRAEIGEMRDWTARQNIYKPETIDVNYKSRMDKVMADMMNNMNMQTSNNPDMDFINMAIPHHQSAIDLAKIEREYGKNSRMINLANKILNEQQEEIKTLQESKTNVMAK